MQRTIHGSIKFNALAKVVVALAIIGALNWGLVGFFNYNLVDAIFGGGAREVTSGLSRFIYCLVGLAGLLALFTVPWQSERHIDSDEAKTRLPTTGQHAEVRP